MLGPCRSYPPRYSMRERRGMAGVLQLLWHALSRVRVRLLPPVRKALPIYPFTGVSHHCGVLRIAGLGGIILMCLVVLDLQEGASLMSPTSLEQLDVKGADLRPALATPADIPPSSPTPT